MEGPAGDVTGSPAASRAHHLAARRLPGTLPGRPRPPGGEGRVAPTWR
ncbi:hypothetical protein [Streptosporangium roseum]